MQDTCTFVLSSDKSFVFFRLRLALPVFLTYHNMRSDLFVANYQIVIVVAKQIPESETLVASIHSIHSFIYWYACYLPIVCEFVWGQNSHRHKHSTLNTWETFISIPHHSTPFDTIRFRVVHPHPQVTKSFETRILFGRGERSTPILGACCISTNCAVQ